MVDAVDVPRIVQVVLLFVGVAVALAAAAPALRRIAPSVASPQAHDHPDGGPPERHIARIDRLTEAGRINWFGLMAYLVFAFITVLGVEDADFFIPSRQTELPLVGVTIPTEAFFYFAPVLGAALFVYLHLYVRKATGALTAAPAQIEGPDGGDPTPLERHLKPWLLNDYVLRRRGDGAVDRRPLDGLAMVVVIALIWCAGPFVLLAIWVRSWPAYNEVMTTLAGACFALSLYAGHVSWVQLRRDLAQQRPAAAPNDRSRIAASLVLAIGVVWLGWIKTESGKLPYDPRESGRPIPGTIAIFSKDRLHPLVIEWWSTLALTNLQNVQFAALEPKEADVTLARHRFRTEWCARHGFETQTCGSSLRFGADPYPGTRDFRLAWCADRGIAEEELCMQRINALERRYSLEWANYRAATIATLQSPDLRGVDLRGAFLGNSALTGVVLRQARLDRADLRKSNLERADLVLAQLEGAYLAEARLEAANLREARLESAVLREARMDRADFGWAHMSEANFIAGRLTAASFYSGNLQSTIFFLAQMNGTDLRWVEMEKADLRRAKVEGADMSWAILRSSQWEGAKIGSSAVHYADFRGGTGLDQIGLSQLVGNAATLLPERLEDGTKPYICTCWSSDPPAMHSLKTNWTNSVAARLRWKIRDRPWFCPSGTPMKTGTPWPLDAAPPWGERGEHEDIREYQDSVEQWVQAHPPPTERCPPTPWKTAEE